MNLGDIYLITSPSGKQYIGQCVKYLKSGKEHGYIKRWKAHVSEARRFKNYSRILDNAIRKYGEEKFTVELIWECKIEDLNSFESAFIEQYNTISPHGYNLTSGGGSNSRHSEETCKRKSISLKGKNKGRIMAKRLRKHEEDNVLPKYIRKYRDSRGREGYRLSSHPTKKSKSFISKYESMEIKLQNCIDYLNE